MWYTLLFKKELWYIVGIISIVSILWISLQRWHYTPLEDKDNKIISLEKELKLTGNALNVCEVNLTKQNLQGFIDGIGENNESIIIGFDNLST